MSFKAANAMWQRPSAASATPTMRASLNVSQRQHKLKRNWFSYYYFLKFEELAG